MHDRSRKSVAKRKFLRGLASLAMAMLQWLNLTLLSLDDLIDRTIARSKQVATFFASIPYRTIGRDSVRFIGRVMHRLLFGFLLPKRYRKLSKRKIYNIIFKSDTPEGKKFDIYLLVLIGVNIFILILDSIPEVHSAIGVLLKLIEWACTLIFTFEYYLRIYCSRKPWKYVLSFYGIIDFLSIFPAYLSLLFPATQTLTVLRILRTLRVFRVLHMDRFIRESGILIDSLRRSMYKILIFMLFVFLTAVVLGAIGYMFEHGKNPEMNNILQGIYWAVVTLTTVGYGDIAPVTTAGRLISVIVMILGYSIIAVPTGIVAGETINANRRRQQGDAKPAPDAKPSEPNPQTDVAPTASQPMRCPRCGHEETDKMASFCKICGTKLQRPDEHSWFSEFFST